MFSSSVRRAALTAPPVPVVSSLSSSAPRAATSQALSYRSHQRRLSSSKPSSPADGSKGIAENVAGAHTGAASGADKKPKSGRRKAKENANTMTKGRHESLQNLPSVPSTHHIAANHISASDFFSLHRPISLTNSFPKPVSDDAFAAIFTSRTKTNAKSSEVISTLSSTLDRLDAVTSNMKHMKLGSSQIQWNEETDDLRASITAESYRKAELQHFDNAPEEPSMNFSRHTLSGKFRPFHPPPPPVPMDTAESLTAGAEAAEVQESHYRTYTAVLTIEETTDANGEVVYEAHSSPLVAEDPPATPTRFLERMQIRQERYRQLRAEENDMIAISVKRQRKLKMKKHKYKKLMKRTRNLRRRLDRN